MIKHVVLFKLKEQETPEAKLAAMHDIKAALDALYGVVPSLLSIEVGLNVNEHEQYDIALMTTHQDLNGLSEYANHPEHLKVGQLIAQYREARACVDFTF